jgi:hypothetical protein
MRKRILTIGAPLVTAAALSLSLAGTAGAQPLLVGEFTLPYEVQWGHAVLPAGSYRITFESAYRPALVRRTGGRGIVFVKAAFVDQAQRDQGTALLVSRGERAPIVRSFNWVEGGKSFVYSPISKAEQGRLARAGELELVTMSMPPH